MVGWIAAALFSVSLGCGQSSAPKHADTGVGANQPVPATIDCADFCQRIATCSAELCDEDTGTMNYDGLVELLQQECEMACTDATLTAKLSPANWQCTFVQSCREVLQDSACGQASSYSC